MTFWALSALHILQPVDKSCLANKDKELSAEFSDKLGAE